MKRGSNRYLTMGATARTGNAAQYGQISSDKITVNSITEARDEIGYRKANNPDQIHSVDMRNDGRFVIVSKDIEEYTNEIVERVMRNAKVNLQKTHLQYKW
jgi:hypothetical protein